jgi:hypothetical protein
LQASDFVFGVEADGDWTNLNGSSSNSYCSLVTVGATCETKSVFWHVARSLGICVRSGPCLRYGRSRRRQSPSGV